MASYHYKKHILKFYFSAGTSRGVLHEKTSYFIIKSPDTKNTGIGECSLLPGLSIDDRPEFESTLGKIILDLNAGQVPDRKLLAKYPAIRFGLEIAEMDFGNGGSRILFPSDFTQKNAGIPINGLVWMGDFDFMKKQLKEKIAAGFSCIKIKIGAIDFEKELELIRLIRKEFSQGDIEIRVDANGAFSPEEALEKLKRLSELHLHSIEQPIRQGQWEKMASLCKTTPLPIALDEELIGIHDYLEKENLIKTIEPQFIILKPSLLGGFSASEEWIDLAEKQGTGWWVTSALESTIGLNAIAQWAFTLGNPMPQGLGTGQLYTNNFDSPLIIKKGKLYYDIDKEWDISLIQ